MQVSFKPTVHLHRQRKDKKYSVIIRIGFKSKYVFLETEYPSFLSLCNSPIISISKGPSFEKRFFFLERFDCEDILSAFAPITFLFNSMAESRLEKGQKSPARNKSKPGQLSSSNYAQKE